MSDTSDTFMSLEPKRARVRDVMRHEVVTLAVSHSLPLVESLMRLHRIRHIPIIDDDRRVVGLVTHRDLLAARLSDLAPLTSEERSTLQLGVPVSKIMREEVWTIRPDASAISAARLMREHHFGCLPVTEEGRLVGILTRSDLLSILTDPPATPQPLATWPIAQVMTGAPLTITPDTTLAEARLLLSRHQIHHLPVVADGSAIGIVCERDLVIGEAIFGSSEIARAAHVAQLLGSTEFRHVRPSARVGDVVGGMVRDRVDAVLVIEAGVLAGIFTLADACRLFGDLLGISLRSSS